MDSGITIRKPRDILSTPLSALFVFWLPAIAIVVTGNTAFTRWRPIVWTIALAIMGLGCVVNAIRCGRVHCFLTGPFLLLMALASALYSRGILPLGPRGWNIIGGITLIGAIALCCVPEMIWGKYRRPHAE